MIELENVRYQYPDGTTALDGVSVDFPRGTISAVLGESGSGKTTLLMCIGQFLKPTRGRMRLDGKEIFSIPGKQYRKAVGIVFQKLYLFPHLSILGNMTLAPVHTYGRRESAVRKEAMAILARLGIEELADRYPNQISGGQAQRAAIARGLLLKPDYMLLDEPTSALDANTTDEFAEWLVSLRGETNFIIVTHDVLFARKAAHTGVYLSGGKVLDRGDVTAIIRHVRDGGRRMESRSTPDREDQNGGAQAQAP